MTEDAAEAFLALISHREGHFALESGYHGELWLDLDGLFAMPRRVAPLVDRLTDALRPHGVEGVCGPLMGGAFLAQSVAARLGVEFSYTDRARPADGDGLYRARYGLPPAFRKRVCGRRIAIVDDVMSAGSAARGTFAELTAHGAVPAAVGALLVLGTAGEEFFAQQNVPVEAAARRPYRLWRPDSCPLCAQGAPVEAASDGPDGAGNRESGIGNRARSSKRSGESV